MEKKESSKKGGKNNNTDNKKSVNIQETNKKKKSPKKHPKLRKFIKIALIVTFVLIIVGAGIIAGLIFGLFGDDLALTKEDLLIGTQNSVIVDSETGDVIATLSGNENREIISKEDMSEYLTKAFVAIEDERFYEHNGVDIKRTVAATVSFLFNKGESSFGGSTITQQLIKNITDEKDSSSMAGALRKIREISRALQIEKVISKDQILELYLNLIYLGGAAEKQKAYGVEIASNYYFNKSASELSITESAFLAGITHSPNAYNPFVEEPKMDKIKKRTITVLNKMLEVGSITKEQFETSKQEVENGINFQKGVITQKSYSYHDEAMINEIVGDLVEQKGWEKEYAKMQLYNKGYTIYSTEKKSIQERIEQEHNNNKYIIASKKNPGKTTQAATIIIDPKTGYVLGCVGGLGEKTTGGWNRATMSTKATGSSMKPIAVIAPALQKGIITAGSVMDDTPATFGSYAPKNYYAQYRGLSNIRYMIRISQNVTEVKLLEKLKPLESIKFLRELGITSLVTGKEDKEKNDENLSLALGGLRNGVTTLEMASAYATIANDGEYIEPTFYTKVLDSKQNVVIESKQEKRRVMSEENAYIMKSILTEPVIGAGGTATACAISGMDVSAKTGTTNDSFDIWLCGFTPYYAGATWYGYDDNETVLGSAATKIWAAIMKDIHKDLPKVRYQKPNNITTASICRDSGLIATEECRNDQRGNRSYSEYFAKGTIPTKTCTSHVNQKICKETGKIANDFCSDIEQKVFITRENSDKNNSWRVAEDARYMLPTEKCDKHTEKKDTEKPIITLKGQETITIKLGSTYKDEGATAKDNKDGDLTSKIKIEGEVNTKKVGTYTITYSVEDSSGNKVVKTRTVKVIKENENTNSTNNTTNNTNTTNSAVT